MALPIYDSKPKMASHTARILFETNSVNFRPERPFTLTSGLLSPVYIDCRRLISFVQARRTLTEFMASLVERDIGYQQHYTLAGGETAGIPFAAWLAERLDLPMHYVRKKPKGFGRDAQIEGVDIDGKKAILIEDLATNGGSKIKFCDALRRAGASVSDIVVIFFYDIFPEAKKELQENGLTLHYLATWRDVLDYARSEGKYTEGTLLEVEAYLADPHGWSQDR